MSDYLGHLATRMTATAASVRPRLLSRFEPAPAASAKSGDPRLSLASTDPSATLSNPQQFFGATPRSAAGFGAIAGWPGNADFDGDGGVHGRGTHRFGDSSGSPSALARLNESRSWNDDAAAGRGRTYETNGLTGDADNVAAIVAAMGDANAGPSASHGLSAAHGAAFDADSRSTGRRGSRRRNARGARRIDASATASDRIDGDAASGSSAATAAASRGGSAGDTLSWLDTVSSDADRGDGSGHELAIGGARAGIVARVRARRARRSADDGASVDASVGSTGDSGSLSTRASASHASAAASQSRTAGLSPFGSIESIASIASIVSMAARDARQSASHARRSSARSNRASSSDRFDSGSADVAPDIVHVTIGRVEVRASVPAPAPAPRSVARETAALSLDQYLRQRTGGGAR